MHDVDFAVIPRIENYAFWKEKVAERVTSIGGTPKTLGEVICDILYRGVQVNLFICPGEDSWGVTLMWATGPKGHTIGMTIKAQKKNLLYNSQGVWTREENPKLIPTPTEFDVARVLDWKYKPPELRGKHTSPKTPDYCGRSGQEKVFSIPSIRNWWSIAYETSERAIFDGIKMGSDGGS